MVTICGDAGMGKTSLAATFPKPIFIRAEDGLQAIPIENRPDAFPELTSFEDLGAQMMWLAKEKHDYQTVVIDSISKLDVLLGEQIKAEDKKDNLAQCRGGFGAGFQAVASMHRRVRKAAGILQQKGMHVVFLAHADVETLKVPDADDYMRWTIRLCNKVCLPPYVEDVDVVGFLRLQMFTKGEEGQRKRAISSGDRELITYATASNVSKNRYGINEPLEVELGVNPLAQYIPMLKQGELN